MIPGFQRLFVPDKLPGLNEIINLRGAGRGFSNPWATEKEKLHGLVKSLAEIQGLKPFGPSYWTYLFIEKNKQRDKRNIAGGATKVIDDALVEAGYIKNDGWSEVLDYRDYFYVATSGSPEEALLGAHLFLGPRLLEKSECLMEVCR